VSLETVVARAPEPIRDAVASVPRYSVQAGLKGESPSKCELPRQGELARLLAADTNRVAGFLRAADRLRAVLPIAA
jgi:hypothetical protein